MNYKDFVYYCKHKMHMKEYHYKIESNINRYNAVRILLVKENIRQILRQFLLQVFRKCPKIDFYNEQSVQQ